MKITFFISMFLFSAISLAQSCPPGTRCAPTITQNDQQIGRRSWLKDCLTEAASEKAQTSKETDGTVVTNIGCEGKSAAGFFHSIRYGTGLDVQNGVDDKTGETGESITLGTAAHPSYCDKTTQYKNGKYAGEEEGAVCSFTILPGQNFTKLDAKNLNLKALDISDTVRTKVLGLP
jgi:hypothetical protein